MPVEGGIIKSPVSLRDINSQIGAGRDLRKLCISVNVNRWSRYKPVRHASVIPLSESQWKSLNYGFAAPQRRSGNDPTETLSDEWAYQKPEAYHIVGEIPSAYRQSDFEFYMHSAEPINRVQKNIVFSRMFNDSVEIHYHYGGIQGNSQYRMNLSDFKELSGYYLCLWIKVDDTGSAVNGQVYWKTAANTIETAGSIKLTASDIYYAGNAQKYKYGLCACSVKKENLNSAALQANFYALPADKAGDMTATLTVTYDSPLNMYFNGIASWLEGTVDGSYKSPKLYMGLMGETGNAYFGVSPHFSLQMRFSVTNKESDAVTIYRNMLRYYLDKTFAVNSEVSNLFSNMWYQDDSTGTYTAVPAGGSVTIGPGATRTIVLETGENMLKSNGSGVGTIINGPQLIVRITIKYNGYSMIDISNLRLINGLTQ